jgi:hypothetical protein
MIKQDSTAPKYLSEAYREVLVAYLSVPLYLAGENARYEGYEAAKTADTTQ